jgi:hypothetical protein
MSTALRRYADDEIAKARLGGPDAEEHLAEASAALRRALELERNA